jgi:uncharacterized protein YndB with AHSA1/START domain
MEKGTETRQDTAEQELVFSQTWPLEVFNTLTLTEKEGQTTLTLQSFPHQATEEERQTFSGMHSALQQGFNGTLDQLANYLAKA